jgi:hypothetical protein
VVENFAWPCYEGSARQGGYDGANLNLCETLYNAPSINAPFFAYAHSESVGSGCPTGGSAISGLAFYTNGLYPQAYNGALFFADYSRDCIWVMYARQGQPDPSTRATFVAAAENPIQLLTGPNGDLFYVDFHGGSLRRIQYTQANQPPTAVAKASPTSGAAPLTVQFDGSASTDPDANDTMTYAWDLDGDGAYDDSTAIQPTFTYTAVGNYTIGLKVSDKHGASDTDSIVVSAGNTPPAATINSPLSTTTWEVGSTITFSGQASDTQDGALPAARLSWSLTLHHCAADGSCHAHPLQQFAGVASGSFTAPDHEYPSYLELRLTATDAGGLQDSKTVRLDPKVVSLSLESSHSGLDLGLNGTRAIAPFSRSVIVGSTNSLSAPSPQTLNGVTYSFASWSNNGAQSHNIMAGSTASTYRATYTADSTPTTYLSDMTWDVAINGWGPIERDKSNGGNVAGDGNTLTLNGVAYTKGLGVHAESDVRFSLGGNCTSFASDIGIDDESGSYGSVVFQVWADSAMVYDSGLMTATSATKNVAVDISGKQTLRLVVTSGGDNIDYDHADWAGARVKCATAGSRPSAPTNLTATAQSTSQIQIRWSDASSNETGFKIERSLDGNTFTQLGVVGAGVQSYTDTGLRANKPYYYRVRAYNAIGDSGYSNVANTRTFRK